MKYINTIKYLRDNEWEMGNGQCGECGGGKPGRFSPHPCYPTKDYEGHQRNCLVGKSLEEHGEKVVWDVIPQR